MNNSQYFYRTVVFTRTNNQVALVDINSPDNVTPLEEWLGTVISLADGGHSIAELIEYMNARYATPPPNLEKTIHSVIDRLLESNLIKLSDQPVGLPYYLAAPIEELDLERARKEIQADGYSVH